MKILLTGKPRIGKTTVIQEFMKLYTAPGSGIITSRMTDDNGENHGFKVSNLEGIKEIIAHQKLVQSNITVGNGHKVDIGVIDNFVVPELKKGSKEGNLVIIDEIGRIQSYSKSFLKTVRELIQSPTHFLGTIVYDDEPFARNIKQDTKILLVEVTDQNRDILPQALHSIFSHLEELQKLTETQSRTVMEMLRQYFNKDMYVQIGKLFNNALIYINQGKVNNRGDHFTVEGNTHKHIVTHVDAAYSCDCDLFNGLGKYKDSQGICSHIQSVMLLDS